MMLVSAQHIQTFFLILVIPVFINKNTVVFAQSKSRAGTQSPVEASHFKDYELSRIDTNVDPFRQNPKWILFNHRMKNLTLLFNNGLDHIFSVANEVEISPSWNQTGFLESIQEKIMNPLQYIDSLLYPLYLELEQNRAFQVINPIINLRSIESITEFLNLNLENVDHIGRLKLIEINSMASTIHSIYKRLLKSYQMNIDLFEINRVMGIFYPSLIMDHLSNGIQPDTFKNMLPSELVSYIHNQITIFGEEDHLIRILERLIQQNVSTEWKPQNTNFSLNYFRSNRDEHIDSNFDAVLDATLYLCLADMEFAILESLGVISSLVSDVKTTDFDLKAKQAETVDRLRKRLERKYRIAEEDVKVGLTSSKRFICDKTGYFDWYPMKCHHSSHQNQKNDSVQFPMFEYLTIPRKTG